MCLVILTGPRVIDILRKGNSNQVIHYFVEKD